ncbi:MAG: putative mannose-phosphate guanylyltransferase [Ilumatobacteraceae bacterium]|nr:putative mannose-phosphate guanylyltransferase [Ilumatobacteraceae bacterium]
MRAVVLVGGFGTRLRPLTLSVPKPMLPVGHVPIIERLITNLVRGGVTDVTLALGFKPEPFLAAFPDGTCAGATLNYAVEPEPLDTAGAIRFAAQAAGIDDTFVVANGDVLTDLDVGQLMLFHRERGAEATVHLIAVDDPSSFGVVALDDHGRVQRFVEKPAPGTQPTNLINAGTYVLEPSVLQRIPLGQKHSIERITFPQVVGDGGLFALATDDYWIDTGTPMLYLQANLDIAAGKRPHDRCAAVAGEASIDPAARVHDSVVAGDVVVGAGAVVRASVLLDGARIGAGARVFGSVVMGHVSDHGSVDASVIGADAVVLGDETLVGVRRPDPDTQ